MQIAEILKKFTFYDFSIRNESGTIRLVTRMGQYTVESMYRMQDFDVTCVIKDQTLHVQAILDRVAKEDKLKQLTDANS